MNGKYVIAVKIKNYEGKIVESFFGYEHTVCGTYICFTNSICDNRVYMFDTIEEVKATLNEEYDYKKDRFNNYWNEDIVDGPYILKLTCELVNL